MDQQQTDLPSESVKTKSLRLALIISPQMIDDFSIYLKHLFTGLADESIPVALVCHPDCDVVPLVSPAVEIINHPAYNIPLLFRQNHRLLIERLTKFKPTVLHCLCHTQLRLTKKLAKQLSLPYLLSINSLQKRLNPLSLSSKRLSKIIVPAQTIADDISNLFPKLARNTKLINIGTFIEDSNECFSDPSRQPSIVVTHPLDNTADFQTLLSAIKHLAIDGHEFFMVLVGGGKAETQIRKIIADLELSQIVTIAPGLQPWRPLLSAADIFIQPKPAKTFDPLLLEAMSVGSAVAACEGGVDDLIIQDKTAVIFDPDDELSIYSSLQKLLDTHEFARQLAENAQQHLRDNHKVSDMISCTLQTYNEAINHTKSRFH